MPYCSPRALQGLKNYKYVSGGYTWLDDIHQPFWNCAFWKYFCKYHNTLLSFLALMQR